MGKKLWCDLLCSTGVVGVCGEKNCDDVTLIFPQVLFVEKKPCDDVTLIVPQVLLDVLLISCLFSQLSRPQLFANWIFATSKRHRRRSLTILGRFIFVVLVAEKPNVSRSSASGNASQKGSFFRRSILQPPPGVAEELPPTLVWAVSVFEAMGWLYDQS